MFKDEDCYHTETFGLQCRYGDLVHSYRWKLITGINDTKLKNRLIVWGKILQIILKYDTRDIGLSETKYNTLSERNIYDLIVKLKGKMR